MPSWPNRAFHSDLHVAIRVAHPHTPSLPHHALLNNFTKQAKATAKGCVCMNNQNVLMYTPRVLCNPLPRPLSHAPPPPSPLRAAPTLVVLTPRIILICTCSDSSPPRALRRPALFSKTVAASPPSSASPSPRSTTVPASPVAASQSMSGSTSTRSATAGTPTPPSNHRPLSTRRPPARRC